MTTLDYRRMDQLITPARQGDADAMDELMRIGYDYVRRKATKRGWWVPGGTTEDLVQTVMIGYLDAVRRWKPDLGTFYAFANAAVEMQFIEALTTANRRKHQMLSQAASLDQPLRRGEDYRDRDRLESRRFADGSGLASDPGDIVPNTLQAAELRRVLSEGLSPLEVAVYDRVLLRGTNYAAASDYIGVHRKAVDNTLQRVRRKAIAKAAILSDDPRFDDHLRAELRLISQRPRRRKPNYQPQSTRIMA